MNVKIMICLGIESTAHTFGASVIETDIQKKGYQQSSCKILSNEKKSYTTTTGGMIPRELSEHHYKNATQIIGQALVSAKISLKEIDLIAFSQGPGIGNALRVGANTSRQLSIKINKPLIGVNHCVAHLEIGRKLCNAIDPLMLYASGANTQIICYENSYYRVFGETLDIGIGNFLDNFGRHLNLGFPAGPKLSEMYYQGKELIELPYTVKGMDLAFSGLLTSSVKKIKEANEGKIKKEDLVYSTMHHAFSMLTEVTERALAHTQKEEVVLGGGVGCSKPLQEMVDTMCKDRGAKLFIPPNSVMIDNAAMIAWTGALMYNSGVRTSLNKSMILPKQRTDDIKVIWRKQKNLK